MRRLLFALMIALLPLRGWVGDAMAMELMSRSQQTSATAHDAMDARQGSSPVAAMHADCPDHAADAGEAAAQPHHAGADCATCTVCQICHGVALSPQAALALHEPLPAGPLPAFAASFSSAERAPGDKPPIS